MWAIFAFFTSIVNSTYYICNQNAKFSPSVFIIYRGFIVALFALPCLFFYDIITAWQFYAIAIIQGIITAYNDLTSFKANQKYGAETVSSIIPINVSFTFIMWCFLEPLIIVKYAQAPIKSLFIIMALGGIIYSVSKYRRAKITKEAFIALLPVMLLGSTISIFNKTIMDYAQESLLGLCFWRVFISSIAVGLTHLIIYINRGKDLKGLFKLDYLKRSWIFIFIPISMTFRNLAMYYTANPSYVSAIVQTSLLWVMFFNRYITFIKFKKQLMKMEKKWTFLMLISIITLVLATK